MVWSKHSIIIAIASLAISSGSRAQSYRWTVTHPENDSGYTFSFTALDSYGEVVTVAGIKKNNSLHTIDRNVIMFFRSSDGGETWKEQDPGLPHFKGDNQDYYFTKVQQIDSLNAVALGDTGLIVRTTDGGNTWVKQNLHVYTLVDFDVDFSDPMTGIVLTGTGDSNILITSDGGTNWIPASFQPINIIYGSGASLCHSYGNESFRVSLIGGITQYITSNNWDTFDSLPPICPWTDDSDVIGLGQWRFYGIDTIVAYGAKDIEGFDYTLIMISTDGGQNWIRSGIPDNIVSSLAMSALDRSVVFCSGSSGPPHILMSMDHGINWNVDTIAFDTTGTGYIPNYVPGVTVTPNGHAVALFAGFGLATGGMIALGVPASDGVSVPISGNQSLTAYPNPLSQSTTIQFTSPESGVARVTVVNLLGEEVARVFDGTLSAGEHSCTWDAEAMPAGMYECIVDMNGSVQQTPMMISR